ncbi:MAG: GldM family protein [Bacteroidota bacterium]
MKRLLPIFLFFIPIHGFAQISLKNTILKHPDSAILFVGVPNLMEISGFTNADDIVLKSETGTITKSIDGQFIVYENNTSKSEVISVYKGNQKVYSKKYSILLIPDPIARFGHINGTTATVAQLLLNTQLHIVLPGSDFKSRFYVQSFRLLIYNEKKVLIQANEATIGNELPIRHIELIKQLKPGAVLIFERIKVSGPDAVTRSIDDLKITIQ